MMSSPIPQEIDSFCTRWSDALAGISEMKDKVEYISNELPSLLQTKESFVEILCNLIKGERYPDLRKATMFDNEFLLYADPGRSFSLRLFIWAPGEYTTVHDHNSWGVIGPASGEMDVVNYKKKNKESDSESVRLVETERMRLSPGETTFTLPLDEGIHKVGNPTA
jgi:predicted metal-dependent enzyme (double-stranded beta helix superfamily)